jgi:6-pyruvoyltetrahydropterin/6-carboxytetrahydropterin synthase
MELRKIFRFEASHILPKHPGKCSRLHGHSWVLHVSVKGSIEPVSGFVKDYAEISAAVKPLIEKLDHKHLGAWSVEKDNVIHHINGQHIWGVEGLDGYFNPTSENLLWWIGRQLNDKIHWSSLALEETCTSYAVLTREEFDA